MKVEPRNKYYKRSRMHNMAILALILGLCSCMDLDQKSARSKAGNVTDFGSSSGNGVILDQSCTTFYDVVNTPISCKDACPELNTKIATADELSKTIEDIQSSTAFSASDIAIILEEIESASGVCIAKSLRPDEEIDINSDFCACKNGKPDLVSNCQTFCNGKTQSSQSILYGTARPFGTSVLLTEGLGNLQNWCSVDLPGSVSPGCNLVITNGQTEETLPITINGNNFQATLSDLQVPYGTIFMARIVETQSQSGDAATKAFQIARFNRDDEDETESLLKIMPISQYHCLSISGTLTGTNFSQSDYLKTHFYFASNSIPFAIPEDVIPPVYCHDRESLGEKDQTSYDRLALRKNHFALWDVTDSRFIDSDSDGFPDINDTIIQSLTGQGVSGVSSLQIFNLLQWPNMPTISGLESSGLPNLGIFMQPWVKKDENGGGDRAFCPDFDDLQKEDDLIFRELGKYVGETEGIYLAQSEPLKNPDGSFINDVMIMKESDLEDVWFYFEDGLHIKPNSNTVNSRTIHYYWPLDKTNPRIKKSDSILYTVKFPTNIGQNTAASGLPTSQLPPDKRFGCVPKS